MLDEDEFLSPYGIRSLSAVHREHPFVFKLGQQEYRVDYTPGESATHMFGGNSNWRGPIWLPVNYILVEVLERYQVVVDGDGVDKLEFASVFPVRRRDVDVHLLYGGTLLDRSSAVERPGFTLLPDNKPGPYAVLYRWHQGSFSRPHFHDKVRHIVVVQGTWWVSTCSSTSRSRVARHRPTPSATSTFRKPPGPTARWAASRTWPRWSSA